MTSEYLTLPLRTLAQVLAEREARRTLAEFRNDRRLAEILAAKQAKKAA